MIVKFLVKIKYANIVNIINNKEDVSHHVNKRINRYIPDNIHNIFLNTVLIPILIQKE